MEEQKEKICKCKHEKSSHMIHKDPNFEKENRSCHMCDCKEFEEEI